MRVGQTVVRCDVLTAMAEQRRRLMLVMVMVAMSAASGVSHTSASQLTHDTDPAHHDYRPARRYVAPTRARQLANIGRRQLVSRERSFLFDSTSACLSVRPSVRPFVHCSTSMQANKALNTLTQSSRSQEEMPQKWSVGPRVNAFRLLMCN